MTKHFYVRPLDTVPRDARGVPLPGYGKKAPPPRCARCNRPAQDPVHLKPPRGGL